MNCRGSKCETCVEGIMTIGLTVNIIQRNYFFHDILQLLMLFVFHYKARFQLVELPSLIFFEHGTNFSVPYDGPTDIDSVLEFINVKSGKRPDLSGKVIPTKGMMLRMPTYRHS